MNRLSCFLLTLWLSLLVFPANPASAEALLDGRIFNGRIGPIENPDLQDSLHFDDGYFWSDICTNCGFLPGRYTAENTSEGIRFSGILESDSRGTFKYDGVVRDTGEIEVLILWEKKRWYWTSRREIAFLGSLSEQDGSVSLAEIRAKLAANTESTNPLCARF